MHAYNVQYMLECNHTFTGTPVPGVIEDLYSFNTQMGILAGGAIMCIIALITTTTCSMLIGCLLYQMRARKAVIKMRDLKGRQMCQNTA